jgi:hypothetical protein
MPKTPVVFCAVKGLEVRLDPGAAARIRAGNGQGDGRQRKLLSNGSLI